MKTKPCNRPLYPPFSLPLCTGQLVLRGTEKACEYGTTADDTGYTVDVYECSECGAVEVD